jgi:hypothetical protein
MPFRKFRVPTQGTEVIIPGEILAHLRKQVPDPHMMSTAYFPNRVGPSGSTITVMNQVGVIASSSFPNLPIIGTIGIEIST